MMDLISMALISIGVVFFIAGMVGFLRFPDVLTRIHSLTKADNLGLGFIVAGLALQLEQPFLTMKMILVWLLVLVASATSGYLIANATIRSREQNGEAT